MICSLSWRKMKNCRSVEFSLTCHLAPEENTETRTPFTLAETLSTGMRLTLSSHLDKIPNQSKGSTFYFGSWFQTAAHREDSQVTGAWGSWPHCHQGQRAMDECTRLTFSFLFHPEPQLLGWCCLYLGLVLPLQLSLSGSILKNTLRDVSMVILNLDRMFQGSSALIRPWGDLALTLCLTPPLKGFK